ncbi:ubiquinone anaerobic biosynthesis accessory factor UbiT [Thauera aromatica]|uniref:Ubiquinone biosynthesis accessory factor UbiT n=1 Tax=Thauera aromatica K172 TaxID=44139 RepID=A0A2R4BRL4_THAAR|nr:SCP2 sterol-binding domain-containing protein [Thauera aromatica]AVR89843.1 Putative lipid carrier protein [Thauera aromatica K172]MCK2095938.1 SCP2 sterol-binding domain-containing protein [Thauera aromatica]
MPALPALPHPSMLSALLPGSLRRRIGARLNDFRVPSFTVPAPIARIVARLPQQPPTHALTLALNLALGRILPRDTLEPLTGRHLQLRVLDAGLRLDFTLTADGFRRAAASAKPDLILSATTRDFLALALREEDPDTLFFSRRLRMEGDTELGLLVKNTLDAVDWDALKAKLIGRRTG